MQWLRTRVGRHPQPSSRGHAEGFRDRGLRRRDGGRAIRRHVPGVPVRRPAAWRDGGRRGPYRDAARGRAEPARGGAFPDEPARGGSAYGRAVAADAEAIARAPYPRRLAGEVTRPGQSRKRGRRFEPVLRDSKDLWRHFESSGGGWKKASYIPIVIV